MPNSGSARPDSVRRRSAAPTGSGYVRSIDRALMATDDPDAVAGAEEREVAIEDLVHQPEELGLDADLRG